MRMIDCRYSSRPSTLARCARRGPQGCHEVGGAHARVVMNVTSSGAYRVEGKNLLDVMGGDSNPFCVAGYTLTLNVTSGSISGEIILTRKTRK